MCRVLKNGEIFFAGGRERGKIVYFRIVPPFIINFGLGEYSIPQLLFFIFAREKAEFDPV